MQPDQREQILAGLLAGELRQDAPEVIEAMRNDPTLLADYEEARRLETTYRRLGSEAIADLAAARQPSGPSDHAAATENLVREVVERHAASATAHRRFAPRRTWLLAAAALLVAGAVGFYSLTRQQPYVPSTLGGSSPDGLAPYGTVERVTEFSWQIPSALGRTFVVHVQDRDAQGAQLFSSAELESSPWEPSPERLAQLPTAFHWRLVVRDADGMEITYSTDATLRR